MKQLPQKLLLLDVLRKHKKLYLAARTFGVTTPTLKEWMRHYGIVANHNFKQQEPTTQRLPWYKRMFAKNHPVPSG